MNYTKETIEIKNPSNKLKDLIQRMRKHKQQKRKEVQNTEPVFTIMA